jgi:uncharacterized protein (DUF305 family)
MAHSSAALQDPIDGENHEERCQTLCRHCLSHPPSGAVAQNAQRGSESTKAFKAADMSMMKNMDAAPYTGNPDVDFRTHMIPHHQGAIAMAKVGLQYATDAETKKMAQKIIDDQEKEVADMQAWLKKNGH